MEQWFWALANNAVTDEMGVAGSSVILAIALNLAMGLALALAYARVVEPALGGPGWRNGMLFSLIPWLFSIVAFLPILGGGWFGMDIDAGPLPVLGNLVLHLVYGAILGSVYGLRSTVSPSTPVLKAKRASMTRPCGRSVAAPLVWWLEPSPVG